MNVRLLPSNCHDPTLLQSLTTFLIDGWLAIDGGSLGFGLSPSRQIGVHEVIVTHSHSDHCASLPIFIAEVFPFLNAPVTIHGTKPVVRSLRENLFNGSIWPDFTSIPLLNGSGPSLQFLEFKPGCAFQLRNLRITPVETNHVVPTVGLAIEDDHSGVVFTSDTYCTEAIWHLANSLVRLDAIFAEASYPNREAKLAEASKHLTPSLLETELKKMDGRGTVYAVHIKPQFREEVVRELSALTTRRVAVAEIDHDYFW
ncbi:MAG: 3',5'-cyclic-nucleotide phosphodiesterase [Acidobacteria bacterium]|nr:3',5'-cyclic-nucleotide phosphodiesterase [Acidobacteriota bacterium]